MKNTIKSIRISVKNLVKRLSLQVILATVVSTLIVGILFSLFVFIYSKSRSEPFEKTLSYLFSIKPKDEEMTVIDNHDQYAVKIKKVEKDIWGDYRITYQLNDELFDACQNGYCSVKPLISTDGGSTYLIIGQSLLLSEEAKKKGELLIDRDLYNDMKPKEEKAILRVHVRIFSSMGEIVTEVYSEKTL